MATLNRRRALGTSLGAATSVLIGGAGCAPLPSAQAERYDGVFVSLGTKRTVALMEPTRGRVVSEASLAPLGWEGAAGELVAGPGGYAAILPLHTSTTVFGIVGPSSDTDTVRHQLGARPFSVTAVPLGAAPAAGAQKAQGVEPDSLPKAAVDGGGRAYVVVADQRARIPARVAVVDLASGTVLGQYDVAPARNLVMSVAVEPTGRRLYVSRWTPDETAIYSHSWYRLGTGTIAVLDSMTGRVIATHELPRTASARQLVAATRVPGATSATVGSEVAVAGVLLATVVTPDPDDSLGEWSGSMGQTSVVALDLATLDVVDLWSLRRLPSRLVLSPGGERLYLLGDAAGVGRLSLDSLHLGSGSMTHHLDVPDGVRAMALARDGSLYIADGYGQRLWRYDTAAQRLRGMVPLDAGPVTVGAW